MQFPDLHSWDVTPAQAVALQKELASRVDLRTPLVRAELVGGADVSYNRFSNQIFASVVIIRLSDHSIVEAKGAVCETHFPYVPGLLSFREAPAVLTALQRLECQPDVLMLDGQGYAHPRRLGIASHIGLWIGIPCIGCAKSLLHGKYNEPGKAVGALAPLRDKDEVIGQVVRTKSKVKPMFVSAGHRIDLPSAVRVVLASCRGYRMPEPTRQAHIFANQLRARGLKELASEEI